MVTVKENVKEFYKAAKNQNWGGFNVYPNQLKVIRREKGHCGYYDPDMEDCPADAIHTFVDGSVLSFRGCIWLSETQKTVISALGLSTKDQCFWCLEYPGSGGSGYRYCHILYAGRELTVDELWLTDLKQRAIDLGYDVRNSTEAIIGWGFYGDTYNEAYNAIMNFRDETGISGGFSGFSHGSGYIWTVTYLYAPSMAGITEPLPVTHDTTLSIAVTDEAGNPIAESVVGETVYIAGQLKDIVDNIALEGALIILYKNGVATANTDITNVASGIYSIPYVITEADVGLLKFKTYFAGT